MPLGPRATGIVIKGGKILLVRDKGERRYSLPGGGIHHGEPSISPVARELAALRIIHPGCIRLRHGNGARDRQPAIGQGKLQE